MRIFVRVLRCFAGVAAAVAALGLIWFAANRLLDESPSAARRQVLAPAQAIADARNVAVGILGLTAPKGKDFLRHGTEIKALYGRPFVEGEIRKMIKGLQALRPTVESHQVTCWLDPSMPLFEGCLPFDQAPAVLQANKELLARYKALYDLDGYAAVNIYYNDAFLVLAKLVIAEMHLDLQNGDHEMAYRKWSRHFRFTKANLRGTDTWVGKAVQLVALGATMPFLGDLLAARPEMAKRHESELLAMLQVEGIEGFSPDGIVRAEFQLLAGALELPPVPHPEFGMDRLHWLAFHFGQKNRILNLYADFAPDYAAALRLPWSATERGFGAVREKHEPSGALELTLDPFGSLFFADYLKGQLMTREMLKQMHLKDADQRLARLAVRLINAGVADANIPAYLAAAGPDFADPLSNTPPRWDPVDRKLYFVDPSEKCWVVSLFRLPSSQGGRRKPNSALNMKAC